MSVSGRTSWIALVVTAIIVGGACAPPPAAPPPTSSLVLVVDESGNPLPDAQVALADATAAVTTPTLTPQATLDLSDHAQATHMSVSRAGRIRVTGPAIAGTVVLQPDPDPADPDADGLSNGEEATLLTDPGDKDTDADGLHDKAESVVDGYPLVALGASPRRRDMFVQYNWDDSDPDGEITPAAIELLRGIYRDSPESNPDGSVGIELHVDTGQSGGGGPVTVAPGWANCFFPPTPPFEFVETTRKHVYFHVIAAPLQAYGCAAWIGGYAYASRSTVIDSQNDTSPAWADLARANVIAHELGHTLGLRHGGFEDLNCKPNYPSLMNYDILPMLILGGAALDNPVATIRYSEGLQPDFDEHSIDEQAPFLGLPGYDIDHDGVLDTSPYARNVTEGSWVDPALRALLLSEVGGSWDGQFLCQDTGELTVLEDHDDWSTIIDVLPQIVGSPIGSLPLFLP